MPRYFSNYRSLIPVGGAIVFAGVAGYLYYKLFQKDEEFDESSESNLPFISITTIELKIPKKVVGAVIGRQGFNIKQIQDNTSTVISFRDDDKEERTCIIKGRLEKVEKAKELILNAIKEVPDIETEELNVPYKAIGRIIGRNGDTIRSLQRNSGAKIKVCDSSTSSNGFTSQGSVQDQTRTLIIKGTKEQLTAAKLSILEKVEEEKRMLEQIKNSASKISQRSRTHQQQNGSISLIEDTSVHAQELPQHLISVNSYNEVYVSAVQNAAHFWAQVVGPRTVQLDRLVAEMSEYYEDPDNTESNSLNIEPGKIVAAKFHDGMWYRGRICKPNIEGQKEITVYFVDFGDTDEIDPSQVCPLRTDFLTLGFQAIECYLASVDFESADTPEATQAFEELSYAAQWKPLLIRVISYKQEGDYAIPFVRVIDNNGEEDIDIAEELVSRGLVKWSDNKSECSVLTSPTKSTKSEK